MSDPTTDPALRSWVASANGHADFPIQNLPLGIFAPTDAAAGNAPRGGVAIGDAILDLPGCLNAGLLSGAAARAAETCAERTLNALFALGPAARIALRQRISAILAEGSPDRAAAEPLLHAAEAYAMHLPARIGDYTDFFAGIHHAQNTGRMLRPENPLLPNYKHVPVAYHGRASSVGLGGAVRRPNGQRKPGAQAAPDFGPSRNLDYELELGIWIGPGNAQGRAIPIAEAADHVAGFCLLNDWSARDIQGWEYQPLGPFLAKNFCTMVSPWVVTPEALAPFRIAQPPRPEGDPAPLPYLSDPRDQARGALAIELEVLIETPAMRAAGTPPERLSRAAAHNLYWTVAQMVAHHASGGCNLQAGDLFGSGTISSPEPDGYGSLLEITQGGRAPLTLATGETRRFLEDGDEIVFRAHAARAGCVGIGFGTLRGRVEPAL